MLPIRKNYESGSITVVTYTNDDRLFNKRVKSLVMDIWNNIDETDFNLDITCINKIIPKEGYEISDVLEEFINDNISEKCIVFALAGALTNEKEYKSADEFLESTAKEVKVLRDNSFKNIIFDRKMAYSYGNSFFYIYMTETASWFIDAYSSEPYKIISRVV